MRTANKYLCRLRDYFAFLPRVESRYERCKCAPIFRFVISFIDYLHKDDRLTFLTIYYYYIILDIDYNLNNKKNREYMPDDFFLL